MSSLEEAAEDHDRVIWQAKPTERAVVVELLTALLFSGAFAVLLVVVPRADPGKVGLRSSRPC